jgi:hypothetical protein
MRRYNRAALLFAGTLLAVVVASAAWATVGKFSGITSSATLTSSPSGAASLASTTSTTLPTSLTATLTVNFTETGLGNVGDSDFITATAHTISTTYFCLNRGSKNPQASNKTTIIGPSAEAGEPFQVQHNGKITGSLTLTVAPADPGTFSCPSGQTTNVFMTFANITLKDDTTGGTGTAPDATTNTVALG